MAHRYFVEWSAPNYRNAGMTSVMADNQPEAVKKAKKKLGAKVKKQFLSKFRAWRDLDPRGRRVARHQEYMRWATRTGREPL